MSDLAKEITESISARRIKVPLPGTMCKRMLKGLIREARWDVIGAYFDFAPKFIIAFGKPVFDWSSCPPAMTTILQQKMDRIPSTRKKAHRGKGKGRATILHREQGGRCFYCRDFVPIAGFSVDHKAPPLSRWFK